MSFRLAIKLTVPLAYFGYATFANIALFDSDAQRPKLEGVLQGEFTQEVDSLYRANLPHREPAVGWVGAARYVLLNEGRKGVEAGEEGWLFTDEEFRPQEAAIAALPAVTAYMSDVQKALAAQGTTLILVPLPAKLDINRAHGSDAAQADALSQTYDRFLAELAAANISFVSPRNALVATPDGFFRTDTHWTKEGAIATAKAIAASGLITSGTDTFTRAEQPGVAFSGDLVSFVTSDSLAPMLGLGMESVKPFIAEAPAEAVALDGELDLFGTSGPLPPVLVGTSYSANANWSFVEALKLSLSQDVLNYAKEGLGPIEPMRVFLQELDPAEAPPVVIWEFPIRYLSDPKLLDAPQAPVEGDGNA
jgi:alginate O-acetyltransferase complex protein AlgJ